VFELKVLNLVGNVIYHAHKLTSNGNYSGTLDLSAFSNGVYYLILSGQESTLVKKLIIQK
jgi:hypothetical protein